MWLVAITWAGITSLNAFGEGVTTVTPVSNKLDRAYSATLLPDGSLFVGGQYVNTAVAYQNEDHAAALYQLTPTLASTPSGLWGTFYNSASGNYADFVTSSVYTPNGIVTGGVAYRYQGSNYVGEFTVTWWNNGGAYRKVTTAFQAAKKGTKARVSEMLLAPDGSIIAVGNDEGVGTRPAIARYNSATGAELAKTMTTVDLVIKGAAIQNGNRILAVGQTGDVITVARFNLNGVIDTTWGTGGRLILNSIGTGSIGEDVVIDGNGKIVIVGAKSAQALVVRLNANGSLDTTFNGSGFVTDSFGGDDEKYTAVNLRQNGLIVATGYSTLTGYGQFVAAQYTTAGTPDGGFGSTGTGFTLIPFAQTSYSYDSVIQNDGRVVLVGETRTDATKQDFALVQLSATGF